MSMNRNEFQETLQNSYKILPIRNVKTIQERYETVTYEYGVIVVAMVCQTAPLSRKS